MIVHTIRRGQFLRSLRPPLESSVPAQISELQVGMEGHIVVQTSLEGHSRRKVKLGLELFFSNSFQLGVFLGGFFVCFFLKQSLI